MDKLPKLTGKEVAKVVSKLGFAYSHTTGSHMVYKHEDGRRVTIPVMLVRKSDPDFSLRS